MLLLFNVIHETKIRTGVMMLHAAQRLTTAECLDTHAVSQNYPPFVPHRATEVAIQFDQQLVGLQFMLDRAQPIIGAVGVGADDKYVADELHRRGENERLLGERRLAAAAERVKTLGAG